MMPENDTVPVRKRLKLYVVSGLGADFTVLERLVFPPHLEVVFLPWLQPKREEEFSAYVKRMAAKIDDSEPFHLLGYSFGGIIVQEIDKLKPAEKIVILGSIKSHTEKSGFLKINEKLRVSKLLPQRFFTTRMALRYSFVRRLFDPKNPRLFDYFTVRDPYYLKWSLEKISAWKFAPNPKIIQILGSKDIIFPLKYSKPDYVIEGGTHLFPVTKPKEVSAILAQIFS